LARNTANRKASAVIDFSPPESSVSRFIALPPGVISISTPSRSSSSGHLGVIGIRLHPDRAAVVHVLAGGRVRASDADQPQAVL